MVLFGVFGVRVWCLGLRGSGSVGLGFWGAGVWCGGVLGLRCSLMFHAGARYSLFGDGAAETLNPKP